MATKTRNISLPPALDEWAARLARTGPYGNLSAVVQAGLRALQREEMGQTWREWQEITKELPQDTITPKIEQEIVAAVRKARKVDKRKGSR